MCRARARLVGGARIRNVSFPTGQCVCFPAFVLSVRSCWSGCRAMVPSKRVSMWSVQEVLEWVQDQHPNHMGTLHKAIIKHAISGRALLRLKDHHLELLGVEAEEQQQEIWQDLLLLRVQEEINELNDICSECLST